MLAVHVPILVSQGEVRIVRSYISLSVAVCALSIIVMIGISAMRVATSSSTAMLDSLPSSILVVFVSAAIASVCLRVANFLG